MRFRLFEAMQVSNYRLAENDLKVEKILLDSANDELMQNSAAYHAEQSVEKALKSML